MKGSIAGILFFVFIAVFLKAEDISVQANLSSDKIALGESVELLVKVSGAGSEDPSVPEVPGLRISAIGRSTQIQIINWKQSSSTTIVYQVSAAKPGEYNIPPISISSGGKNYQTSPLKLTVLRQAGGIPGEASNATGNPQPSASSTVPANLPEKEESRLAFVRISDLPEKLYVGQVQPVVVRIYIQQRLAAKNVAQPVLRGDAFAFQPLKFKQENQTIEGVPYFVLIAPTSLAAIKEGKFPFSLDVNVTVLQRERGRSDDVFGNDPFFKDFFARMVEKNVTISSPQKEIAVEPLPEKGRPASFGGAIGKFELHVSSNASEVRMGDPLNLKMEIKGKGNFDRVTAPVLVDSKGWKAYSPSASFKPDDFSGYEGVKIFEQALIPMEGDAKTLPSLEFSYFDTESGKYEVVRPTMPSVAVLPSSSSVATPSSSIAASSPLQESPEGKKMDLVAMHVEMGQVEHDWRPILRQPWFWAFQGLPLAVALAGFVLGRKYKRSLNPEYHRQRQLSKRVGSAMDLLEISIANGDSASFVTEACKILRENYGHLWNITPESITLSDIRSRQADSEVARSVFETSDAVLYAGRRISRDEMANLKSKILQELQKMEKKK